MLKESLIGLGLVLSLGACEKKAPPTAQDRATAAAAQNEAKALEAARDKADHEVAVAKDKADQQVDVAKEKLDVAKDNAEAAKDKADDVSDKLNVDWKGPDDNWNKDYVVFVNGNDRTADRGDYIIERDKDGTISAWRKTKQVAGNAFNEVKDAALVTQVKAKLAADDDTKAHQINVDADDHVVSLRGTVDTPEMAAEAVRIALATPGTEKVVSLLTWKK